MWEVLDGGNGRKKYCNYMKISRTIHLCMTPSHGWKVGCMELCTAFCQGLKSCLYKTKDSYYY